MSDTELIERLAAIPYTGAVSDILDEMGWHDQSLPAAIQSLVPGQTLAGRALTLRGQATESEDPDVIFVPFLKMLGEIQPGDVLVYETNDDTAAHLGELSSETAKFRGARGAVIDGGARDTEYMVRLGFPVFSRYRTMRDIRGRWRLADYNVPITVGGVAIEPGDAGLGKGAVQLIFNALRPQTDELHKIAVAFRATIGNLRGPVAVVAQHPPVAAMVRHRHRTVLALDAFAAGAAGNEARKAATVQ